MTAHPLRSLKNPPKRFAWRATNGICVSTLNPNSLPQAAKTILAAFFNAFNKHMFVHVSHRFVFSLVMLLI